MPKQPSNIESNCQAVQLAKVHCLQPGNGDLSTLADTFRSVDTEEVVTGSYWQTDITW